MAKSHVSMSGGTAHFRKDPPVYLENRSKFKLDHQERKKRGKCKPNAKRSEKENTGQWAGGESGINVIFTEIENGDPRNAALSTEQTDPFSDENEVNFADREVLFPMTVLGRTEW